ncbi:CASP-like protein [Forsythia ovata]|uniref:CASP-like protein n=1 Tax=Forsythia ovata TaxID=205694 RepID=A0ABD1U8D0_9LAMI
MSKTLVIYRQDEKKMKLKKGCMAVQVGLENGPFQRFVIPISYLCNPFFQRLLDRARMNAGNERFVETGEELDKGDFSSEGKDDIVENVVHQYWSPYTSNELSTRVSAAVAFHSLLQLLINTSRVLRKSPVIPSRNHAWLVFAADQVMDGNL